MKYCSIRLVKLYYEPHAVEYGALALDISIKRGLDIN